MADRDPKKQFMFQAYKGQLQVAIYDNSSLLTIHVIKGQHLHSEYNKECSSYVQLSLIPEDDRKTGISTDVVPATNSPEYNEKFSFELVQEDRRKRVLVSVWNKEAPDGMSELLGSMSFGVESICNKKKTVNGWYYLLEEEVGSRKHLRVGQRAKHLEQHGIADEHAVPPTCTPEYEVPWMETHKLLIKRGVKGYGISIAGYNPVHVTSVDSGCHAEQAGLQAGDQLVQINGIHVTASTTDAIAKIIRHSSHYINLCIQRAKDTVCNPGEPIKPHRSVLKNPADLLKAKALKNKAYSHASIGSLLNRHRQFGAKGEQFPTYGSSTKMLPLPPKRVKFKEVENWRE